MERIFWTCSWMLFLMELNGGAFFLAADDRLNDNIIQPSCRLFSISFFFYILLLVVIALPATSFANSRRPERQRCGYNLVRWIFI